MKETIFRHTGRIVRGTPAAVWFGVMALVSFAAFKPAGRAVDDGTLVIVIDAGHGGKDPGCNGAGEIWEKQVTLNVALKLGKMLQDSLKDVKVLYTRKTDVFVELWQRPELANKNNADLFISIHCNSNANTQAAGSETYLMGLHKSEGNLSVAKRENAAITLETNYQNNANYGGFDPNSPEGHIIFSLVQNAYMETSSGFAAKVEQHIAKTGKIKSRGVKQAGFLVLWRTAMPSVLVELGFLTNPSDRAVLKTSDGQQIVSKAIFNAVKQYKQERDARIHKPAVKPVPVQRKDSALLR
ncbi:MAG: N-acetylmuramoyl-L-alanine amidase family protein [Bacteroidia bacterium]|jgi:N-acetylmuramoyl-L-alanine amidase